MLEAAAHLPVALAHQRFETLAPLMCLMTSETVDCETPASLAMSVMVGRRGRAGAVMKCGFSNNGVANISLFTIAFNAIFIDLLLII
jgi:hypothetical protein